MEHHNDRVKAVSERVRHFHETKQKFRIYHGSTNSTRSANFDRDKIVDTSNLNHVLSVDKSSMTAKVEPNVPLDKLVDATLAHGLIPPVVMEFPGITVGGGFSGTSAESSSFKHGLFEQTIVSIEMVLADGTLKTASASENSDLLYGAAGAFGTLGVLTMLEIKLIKAAEYVELTYIPVSYPAQAITTIDECMSDSSKADFIDGILYSSTFGLVVKGRLTSKRESHIPTVRFSRRHDPWFYLHARRLFPKFLHPSFVTPPPVVEYTPLRDYLFRYDRGAFWTARYSFRYFFVPFNRVTRFLLDKFLHTRVMYHALHASGLAKHYIVQDLCVPVSAAPALVEYIDAELGGFYPLWLCPLPGSSSSSSSKTSNDGSAETATSQPPPHPHLSAVRQRPDDPAERPWTLNFGVWGPLRGRDQSYDAFVAANRALERKIRDLGGVKTLYAHAYYTQDEFDEIYDSAAYQELRRKYGAEGLPSVYDKVKVNEVEDRKAFSGIKGMRPLGGLIGVASAVLKKDYMLAKSKSRKAN